MAKETTWSLWCANKIGFYKVLWLTCLSLYLSTCISRKPHGWTSPDFLFVLTVVLWQHCNMLFTSNSIHDIMFLHNELSHGLVKCDVALIACRCIWWVHDRLGGTLCIPQWWEREDSVTAETTDSNQILFNTNDQLIVGYARVKFAVCDFLVLQCYTRLQVSNKMQLNRVEFEFNKKEHLQLYCCMVWIDLYSSMCSKMFSLFICFY